MSKTITIFILFVLVPSLCAGASTVNFGGGATLALGGGSAFVIGPGGGTPYEDFTGYTEVDPTSEITVDSATKISWASLGGRDDLSYVYVDKTSDHFNGDFVHQFEVYPTALTLNSMVAVWGVSDSVNDSHHWNDGIAFTYAYNDSQWILRLTEADVETAETSGAGGFSFDTLYFVTVTLDWDGGTNSTGLITAEIRTTSHTNETGKITLSMDRSTGEQNSYRYLYGMSAWDDNQGASSTVSGYVQNLDINESGGTEILRPLSDAQTTGWAASSGTDRYLMVDEVSQDGDTTYNECSDTNYYLRFNFTTALTTETITSIEVHTYMRGTVGDVGVGASIRWNSTTTYNGTGSTIGSAGYTEVTHTWTENPYTASAWVPSDIADFSFGGYMYSGSTVRATQTYLVVNYE